MCLTNAHGLGSTFRGASRVGAVALRRPSACDATDLIDPPGTCWSIDDDVVLERAEGRGRLEGVLVYSAPGAMAPAVLEDLISQVKNLDMHHVRATIAARKAAATA